MSPFLSPVFSRFGGCHLSPPRRSPAAGWVRCSAGLEGVVRSKQFLDVYRNTERAGLNFYGTCNVRDHILWAESLKDSRSCLDVLGVLLKKSPPRAIQGCVCDLDGGINP